MTYTSNTITTFTTRCNRCGTLITKTHAVILNMVLRQVDLCSECTVDFHEFMGNGKEEYGVIGWIA